MKESPASRLLHSNFSDRQITLAIRFLFVVSVFLIVILSVSYNTINEELVYYSERVDHTHDVLDKIQKIRVTVYETTYSGRGFLVLGDESNRKAMLSKATSLPQLADSLREILDDNQAQVDRIGALRDLLKLYQDRIDNFARSNPIAFSLEQKIDLMRSGTLLTASINTQLDRMEAEEAALKTNRTENRDSYEQQIFRFNWIIMAVALVFLLASFLLLERELKTNRHYKVELESKVENLNRSNSELEQFAYVASHDLQEPLRKIRSFTDFIKTKRANFIDDSTGEMLTKIDRSAIRMQMLIDDLLSFSRSLQTTEEPAFVSLDDVLLEVKNNALDTLNDVSGTIALEALPVVLGYESQLTQLFQNIVNNAIKYRKTSEKLLIRVSCDEVQGIDVPKVRSGQEEDVFHKITFEDNGIGFGQEFSEKIFVIFQRLHGIEAYEGSGIGLAICRKVVLNHKGYIIAESEVGLGAKFCVYLPKIPS